MIYVLDTDILTLLGHEDSSDAPRIRRKIAELPTADLVVTTIINFEEQMRGWMAVLGQAKSSKAEVAIYRRLLAHLATFRRMTVLGYDDAAAVLNGYLRAQRLRIGAMDLKIAAVALAHQAVLVTRNRRDFQKVPGLRIEDWTRD